ncbi:hypothetical protein [Spirillospora sp. NBC_01491]|uniref:hypothetical protein n=1 Tax=Spirillospora sp. NBC_01491 TaxID=2976007 RepID=UPI002E2EA9A9|nr:hypothetical protein [Spirillospora sp. NBC_01491]
MTNPTEGREQRQPPATAWRYGEFWDFADRLASALALNGGAGVWVWPENVNGPELSPEYVLFCLDELVDLAKADTDVSTLLWEAGQGWRFSLETFRGAHTVTTLKTAYPWQPLAGGEEAADEQVVFAAAAAACRAHPRSPRFHVHVGPVESWDWMVEALIAAGARSRCLEADHGGRYFKVRPPLSAQQVDALRLLDRGEPGVTVSCEPPEADLWRVDPAAPDPYCDYDPHAWWRWQLAGGHPDKRPPRGQGVSVRVVSAGTRD